MSYNVSEKNHCTTCIYSVLLTRYMCASYSVALTHNPHPPSSLWTFLRYRIISTLCGSPRGVSVTWHTITSPTGAYKAPCCIILAVAAFLFLSGSDSDWRWGTERVWLVGQSYRQNKILPAGFLQYDWNICPVTDLVITYQPSRREAPRSPLPSVHPRTAVWSRTASLFELPHWVFGLQGALELGYSGLVGVEGEANSNSSPHHSISILWLLCYICMKVAYL